MYRNRRISIDRIETTREIENIFNARSIQESELRNIHRDITDAVDRQDRRIKFERWVSKLKDVFSKLVQKNEEQIDLASKTENPDSIILSWRAKREEAEKQEQAAMRLGKQKHQIAMRKKELEIQMEQMALQELEEDHRQRVAAANLFEAVLMNKCSLFSRHSTELNLLNNK